MSELCDADCGVYFHKQDVKEEQNGETIVESDGSPIIPPPTTSEITPEYVLATDNIYDCSNIKELMLLYHAWLFYPVISTWCMAIWKGYL